MTETPEQRVARVRAQVGDKEKCRRCGMLRINVVHEPDPDNAPEGKAYYEAVRSSLHPFIPSGQFQR